MDAPCDRCESLVIETTNSTGGNDVGSDCAHWGNAQVLVELGTDFWRQDLVTSDRLEIREKEVRLEKDR
jgi:hypothetical protein